MTSAPAAVDERPQAGAVGVGDAGRAERLAGRADLVAGREDGDARPAMDDDRRRRRRPPAGRRPRRRSRSRARGASRPSTRSLPGRAGSSRRAGRPRGPGRRPAAGPVASRPRGPGRPAASSGVVASTGTTASAPSGSRAPVAIRTAVPGRTVDVGRDAGPHLADDLEARPAPSSVAAVGVGGPDRVAVHRRVRPRRQRGRARRPPRRRPARGRRDARSRSDAGRSRGGQDRVARRLDAQQARARRPCRSPRRDARAVRRGPGSRRPRARRVSEPGERAAAPRPAAPSRPARPRPTRARPGSRSRATTIGSVGIDDHQVLGAGRRPAVWPHPAELAAPMTPSSSAPRTTGRAIDERRRRGPGRRTCRSSGRAGSPGHVAVHDVADAEAVEELVETGTSFDGPGACEVRNQPHRATIRPSIGSSQDIGDEDPDDRRARPGTSPTNRPTRPRSRRPGPRVTRSRPGEAADDPATIERERRDAG